MVARKTRILIEVVIVVVIILLVSLGVYGVLKLSNSKDEVEISNDDVTSIFDEQVNIQGDENAGQIFENETETQTQTQVEVQESANNVNDGNNIQNDGNSVEQNVSQNIAESTDNSQIQTITQTEVNEFNGRIEIFEGESISGENVKKLLAILDGNIEKAENTPGNNKEIKITITKGFGTNDIINSLNKVIDDKKYYKIELEYDDVTKLINGVLISI